MCSQVSPDSLFLVGHYGGIRSVEGGECRAELEAERMANEEEEELRERWQGGF
jgi:hypothetical protein